MGIFSRDCLRNNTKLSTLKSRKMLLKLEIQKCHSQGSHRSWERALCAVRPVYELKHARAVRLRLPLNENNNLEFVFN